MNTREILSKHKTVAIVGVSPKAERDSNKVAGYLMEQGYNVIPVNPFADKVLGKTCYTDLSSIAGKVEIVDIFRKSEEVMPIVEEAIKKGVDVVWMQEGVMNSEAAAAARKAGLEVVMDTCIKKEHTRLFKT